MAKIEERDLSKLPKWAQREIEILRRGIVNQREYYGGKLKEACVETETPIKLDMAQGIEGFVPIGTRVKFNLVDGSCLTVFFNEKRTAIKIMKYARLSGVITIHPDCSNVVEVE